MFRILSGLQQEFEYNDDIQFLYEILDKDLNSLVSQISSEIYDFDSANTAKNTYNKEWFINLLMSVDAKVKLATLLKTLSAKFQVSSLTWDAITNLSTSIIEQIDILQNKDNFRKSLGE